MRKLTTALAAIALIGAATPAITVLPAEVWTGSLSREGKPDHG